MLRSPLSDAAGGLVEDPPCLFVLSAKTIHDLGIRDCSSVRKKPLQPKHVWSIRVRLPPRLLAHLRRWRDRKLIATCFVEFNGKPVASVKKGFKRAVGLARLPGKVTPHTLRHTAATWLMQRGVTIWEAAGFLGMSPEVLQDTYGHHHPDHLHGAAAAIGQKGRYVSVAETVVDLTEDRNQKKNSNEIWSEWQDLNLRPLRPERSALPG
jgi:integrase